MLEENAIVVDVERGMVELSTRAHSACGHCGASGSCAGGVLGELLGSRQNRLYLPNTLGLRAGERVVIGIPDGLLVRASLMAYLLPLIGLFAGALAASSPTAGDAAVAGAGLLGLGLGLLATWYITGGARARSAYRPQILRRVVDAPVVSLFTHVAGVSR